MSDKKGEVKVDMKDIMNLSKEQLETNQVIGAQRKTIEILEKQLKDEKANHEAEIEKTTKEIRVQSGHINTKVGPLGKQVCKVCGYTHTLLMKDHCYNCGAEMQKDPIFIYKNLEDVVDMIRKEESKRLIINNVELETVNEVLAFDLAKSIKKEEILTKKLDIEVTEAKSRVRERLNGIISEKDKEIDELKAEIIKIQDDKTDAQIEELRKQEIIDLKAYVQEIEIDKENLIELLPLWKRIKFNNKKAQLEALIEKTNKEERIEEISNEYPRVYRANKINRWLKSLKNQWITKAKASSRYDESNEYPLNCNTGIWI